MAISINEQGLSFVQYTADGTTANFPLVFEYIDQDHVKVFVGNTEVTFTWLNASTVTPDTLPSSGDIVTVRRFTPNTARLVDFQDGGQLSEALLDKDSTQMFYLSQESADTVNFNLTIDPLVQEVDFKGNKGVNTADPTDPTDVTNKQYVDAEVTAVETIANTAVANAAASAAASASASSAASAASAAASAAQAAAEAIEGIAQDAVDTVDLHIADSSNAHNASAIGVTASNGLAATQVQAALDEHQIDINTINTDISNHLSDASDAHDASAISVVASNGLVATEVQAALDEHQTDINTANSNISDLDTALADHLADTTPHSIIENSSIRTPTRLDVKQDTESNLITYAATASNGQLVFATDTKEMFQVIDGALMPVGEGGGGSTTLQQAYVNSTTPEIVTDTTRGAFTVKRGSAADTDNVLEIENAAGSVTASITGAGVITGSNLTGTNTGDATIQDEVLAATKLSNIRFPNNLVTPVGTDSYRVNISDTNLLSNANFEHSTTATSWTLTNATSANDTTNKTSGTKAIAVTVTSAGGSIKQSSTLFASTLKGSQGIARASVYTTGTDVYVCPLTNGSRPSDITKFCALVPKSSTSVPMPEVIIPFILDGTSNGIEIFSTGTSAFTVDETFVGKSAPFQGVSGAKLIGTLTYTATTNCQWATSSSSFADFAADPDCPTPTVTGSLSARATKIPGFTINNALPGTYRIVASGLISRQTSSGQCAYRYYDGTNSSPVGQVGANTTNVYLPNFEGHINLNTTQSTWNVSLQALSSTGTAACYVELDTAVHAEELTFAVYYFPPESKIYSQASQDTDWQACTFSTLAWQGLGTVTNNLICKRSMGDLLIKGSFTTGTVAASIAQIPLPTNFGTITTSSLLLSNTVVGFTARGYASAPTTSLIFGLIAQPSQTYLNVSNNGNTQYDIPVNGSSVFNSSEKEYISELRVPINEWKNYGVIVGSFAGIEKCANDYECTDTFSAQISSAGVVSNQNIPWISSVSKGGTGIYNITYNTNLKDGVNPLSSIMNCVAVIASTNTEVTDVVSSVSTGVTVNILGAASDRPFTIKCQKGTNDYKPKTAKVASSIGVPTVPGITTTGTGNLIDTFSFSYGTTNATTVCSASPCSYLDQIGTAVSSVTRSSTGTYNMNTRKTYTKLKCVGGAGAIGHINSLRCENCNSIQMLTGNASNSALVDSFGTIYCQGSY